MADAALQALVDYSHGKITDIDVACQCVLTFIDQFFADIRSDNDAWKGLVDQIEDLSRSVLSVAWQRENISRLATLVVALSSIETVDHADALSAIASGEIVSPISSWRAMIKLGHEGRTAAGLDGNEFCDLLWTAILSGSPPDHYLLKYSLRVQQ